MPRSARRNAGFTLIELMIALVIMTIMVMAVAPALSELLADNRQSAAAFDILKLARRARSTAVSTGIAQLLLFETTTDTLGTITLYSGMNGRCTQTLWDAQFNPTGAGMGPTEIFDMVDYNPVASRAAARRTDTNRPVIAFDLRFNSETATALTAGAQICYQSNGETYAAATPDDALAVQTGPMLLTVLRTFNTVSRGVERQVLFPISGNARLR